MGRKSIRRKKNTKKNMFSRKKGAGFFDPKISDTVHGNKEPCYIRDGGDGRADDGEEICGEGLMCTNLDPDTGISTGYIQRFTPPGSVLPLLHKEVVGMNKKGDDGDVRQEYSTVKFKIKDDTTWAGQCKQRYPHIPADFEINSKQKISLNKYNDE